VTKHQDTDNSPPGIELIDTLELLLSSARSGELTGIAYAASFKRGRYVTDVSGRCAKHITYTRGMLLTLLDELGVLIAQRDPHNTR
jgi:hypothetical protein